MSLLIKSGRIFFKGKLVDEDILIEEGKIEEIGSSEEADEVIDVGGKVVLPGAIDCHVHFREPGMEWKGDWSSESRAAAKGGVTTVLEMPNTKPPTATVKDLEEKKKIASKKSAVNYGLFFGATNNNFREIEKAEGIAGIKVYMGSTTGDLLVTEDTALRQVFQKGKKKGKVVAVHAEEEEELKNDLKEAKRFGWNKAEFHDGIRSKLAAIKAVKKALELQKEVGNKIHICHVATAEEFSEIEKCRAIRKNITCEVTPHHLFLTHKIARERGNYAKVNPPLRLRTDQIALMRGIKFGVIDLIATDHAPHTKEEKEKDYWNAPAGMPGVETMMPLMLNAVNEGKIALEKLIELVSVNPCKVYGIKNKGAIEEGRDADLIVVDLKKEQKIKEEELFTKCKWSLFEGMKLNGVIEKTIVNGKIIYSDGSIINESKGREVEFGGE